MDNKFSYSDLATQIRAVPGKPGFERSIEILNLLLNAARSIDDTAPIFKMLEMDIVDSKPSSPGGFAMGISLASNRHFKKINEALVQYLLVPLGGSRIQGRDTRFVCRQFQFAVRNKLPNCLPFRSSKTGLTYFAVADGVFFSDAHGSGELGLKTTRLAASYVSKDLWISKLTFVADKTSVTNVVNLVLAKEKNDMEEYKKIKDKIAAKL
jgi:hypothetical protein